MPFVGRIGGDKGIFLLTPDQLNNFQEIMRDNHIYQIGDFVMNQISMILMIYILVVVLILPCIYFVYKKIQL